jgi:hypothetical protein
MNNIQPQSEPDTTTTTRDIPTPQVPSNPQDPSSSLEEPDCDLGKIAAIAKQRAEHGIAYKVDQRNQRIEEIKKLTASKEEKQMQIDQVDLALARQTQYLFNVSSSKLRFYHILISLQ